MPQLQDLPLADVRSSRHAQRLELARVSHWRRLLRARIDLVVAVAVLPEPLGGDRSGVLPSPAERDLPAAAELVDAMRQAGPSEFDRLGTLFDLDRRLASYEATVSQSLGGTTEEFIRRLAMNPASTLADLQHFA